LRPTQHALFPPTMAATPVVIKTEDDQEIPVSDVSLLLRYWGFVKEIPGFGPDDDIEAGDELPLPFASKGLLEQILTFTERFSEAEFTPERPIKRKALVAQGIPEWASDLITTLSVPARFELLEAAEALQFDGLVEFAAAAIAHIYVSMDEDTRNATFGLSRDLTPHEEAEIRRKNPWAEEA
jgi:hypothetical protein